MQKIFLNVLGISALLCIATHAALAAEVSFVAFPDTGVIEVRVDPQEKELNVVEGIIQFSGPASDGLSVQIENGQSLLPIWPTPPLYDENTKSINFTGGVPNGFSSEGLLFRLLVSPAVSGDLTVAYVQGGGYLNDGKGTKESVSSTPLKIFFEADGTGAIPQDTRCSNIFVYGIVLLLALVLVFVIFKYVFKEKRAQ